MYPLKLKILALDKISQHMVYKMSVVDGISDCSTTTLSKIYNNQIEKQAPNLCKLISDRIGSLNR